MPNILHFKIICIASFYRSGKAEISKMFVKSQAPAAERNKAPILEVLKDIIKVPENSTGFPRIKVLEISSGTGQHVAHFAKHLHPQIYWQPSDYDTTCFSSICAYIQQDKLLNVAPPVYVDIREDYTKWKPICNDAEKRVSNVQPIIEYHENFFDYIYNSNLIHISSFDCTEGLFHNSGKLLKNNGILIMYGPFGQNGRHLKRNHALQWHNIFYPNHFLKILIEY